MRLSKSIYLNCIDYLVHVMGISRDAVTKFLEYDVEKYVHDVDGLLATNRRELVDNIPVYYLRSDIAYYYKRSRQYLFNNYTPYDFNSDILDTTLLLRVEDCMIIDTVIQDAPVSVFVWKRTEPVDIYHKYYDYIIDIFADENLKSAISIFVGVELNLHKVFIIDNDICKSCGVCKMFNSCRLLSRRRHDRCPLCNPFDIVKMILTVLEAEQLALEKRRSKLEELRYSRVSDKVHVAHLDSYGQDTILPLKDYTYQYHESNKGTYKGGHHKPPVAHVRRGYFRKSNVGDHVLQGNEFIPVKKGTGTHTWVDSYTVNFDSDDVGYHKM